MSPTKSVFFYIFLILAIANTVYMYLGIPLSNYTAILFFLITNGILLFSGLLNTIALSSYRRVTLKTCFRFQIMILSILVVISLSARINELIVSGITQGMAWRIIATGLYAILLLISIGLSRDVFKKLVEIYDFKKIKE